MENLLYEKDFHQWTIEQSQALRERNVEQLDWENIIEEIEALGRSDYSSVTSLLMRQIEHRLKIDYVPLEQYKRKWEIEVFAFKKNIKRKYAPSMKPKLEKEFKEIFQDAADLVQFEYQVSLPEDCPYTLDELLF